MNILFNELQAVYYAPCSDMESNILKTADNLKCSDNRYAAIWLSKWPMNTNSDLGLILMISVNKSLSQLSGKILGQFFFF